MRLAYANANRFAIVREVVWIPVIRISTHNVRAGMRA